MKAGAFLGHNDRIAAIERQGGFRIACVECLFVGFKEVGDFLIHDVSWCAIESLVFTLKEGFEFGEMARRSHENVLAEMLEKVLAYNISQIIRVRKKLSELEQMERAAA